MQTGFGDREAEEACNSRIQRLLDEAKMAGLRAAVPVLGNNRAERGGSKRSPKACLRCRSLKGRCIGVENGPCEVRGSHGSISS
jgi:hypothetical protein